MSGGPGITRRRFVRGAGITTAAAAGLGTSPVFAATRRRLNRRPTVAVFGGGIAGLTAAHELVERGFDVTVYEARAWGGKARSSVVEGSGTGGRKPLPGEHAYRSEFGCYQNVPDTMRRIPFESNPNGVFDNMVGQRGVLVARTNKHDLALPLISLDPRSYTPQQVIDTAVGLTIDREVRPDAAAHLANRLAVFFSSCDERRADDWDRMTWRDFIAGDRYGDDYRAIFERLWEFIQASRGDQTCARYPGVVLETWIVQPLLGRGTNGPVMRALNLPTDEAWIDPWVGELERLGVSLRLPSRVSKLHVRDGRIEGAVVRTPHGRRAVVADHYVCALPVEHARRLWSPEILAADPRLANMNRLGIGWMNGISYFMREPLNIIDGYVLCADSPWAASFITQAQYWPVDFASTYGDGTVHDKLSAVVANWDEPGFLYRKPARDLSPDQVALDLWEQIKQHVNNPGRPPLLTDAMLHSWQIDPGMRVTNNRLISGDPLVLPTVGSNKYRPRPATGIHNLTLCGDYLDGPWEVANMEAASFNGRRAANVVLDSSGLAESRADAFEPFRPPEWEPLKHTDAQRYARGQPNLFDVPAVPPTTAALLQRAA